MFLLNFIESYHINRYINYDTLIHTHSSSRLLEFPVPMLAFHATIAVVLVTMVSQAAAKRVVVEQFSMTQCPMTSTCEEKSVIAVAP